LHTLTKQELIVKKNELQKMGIIVANTLHNSSCVEERAGVIACMSNLYKLVTDGFITHEQYKIMEDSYSERLDELEPLDRGRKR
jgi:hypothetical protein